MQVFLEQNPGSEPNDLIDRMEKLSVYLAQSGVLLAEAKYYQEKKISDSLKQVVTEYDNWSASVVTTFTKSLAKEYNFLVNQLDRLNSSCVHQMDSLRSILSYRKNEMQL